MRPSKPVWAATPAHRHEPVAVGAPAGVGAAEAHHGEVGDDQARSQRGEGLAVEAPAVEAVGRVVGGDDVGGGDQLADQLLALGRVDVQRDGPLAGAAVLEHAVRVERDDGGRLRADVADRVEPVLRLELDHVGAEVGQQPGGERAGDGPREVDDAHAGQRLAVVDARRPPPPAVGVRVGELGEDAVVGAERGRRAAVAPSDVGAERRAGEADPLAVGLVDVDEEVPGRQMGVLGDVGDLVDRRHEQAAAPAPRRSARPASPTPASWATTAISSWRCSDT